MIYKESDLHVVDTAIDIVRSRPEVYAARGRQRNDMLTYLIHDILTLCENVNVDVVRIDDWSVVRSSVDWMGANNNAWFAEIKAFPELGPDSFHAEILFSAFAKRGICVSRHGELHIGDKKIDIPTSVFDRFSDIALGRALAFLI